MYRNRLYSRVYRITMTVTHGPNRRIREGDDSIRHVICLHKLRSVRHLTSLIGNPPLGRYILVILAVLIPGYFTVTRIDRAIDCIEKSNVEIMKANAQLSTTNRKIGEMQEKLTNTSLKLDETNANISRTNSKFDEANTRFVAVDKALKKLPFFRE
jgi:hypothetical protein